jgi:hypothetical protein
MIQDIELRLRLRDTDARLQPTEGQQSRAICRIQRHNDVCLCALIEAIEPIRNHAKHGDWLAIYLDVTADNARITSKSPLPQSVADNAHWRAFRNAIVSWREDPPDKGAYSERFEKIRRNALPNGVLCVSVA